MRRSTRVIGAATIAVLVPVVAVAQTFHAVPSIEWESTLTDNVNLTADRTSDWVNQFSPRLTFNETSARTKLHGVIAAQLLLYARTSENNRVFPQADVNGTYEAIDKFLFVDAFAHVSQQFETPFGARSTSLANATSNRYTAQSYGVTPYIRGVFPGDVKYELKDNNTWSNANALAVGNGQAYTNEVVGHLLHDPTPAGWALEYDRAETQFSGQDSQTTELARLRGLYRPDPTLEGSASVGYEDNRFIVRRERGAIYGLGIRWRPTNRTTLDANVEHRFFGSAYDFLFDHRTRLSVWSLRASRNTTSYPQQLATLPLGGNVAGLLDALFASRIVDPVQRQAFVDQFIRDRGLPAVLTGPVPLLAQQVTLVEAARATAGIIGARNSILFSVFRSRSEPIEADRLEALVSNLANNTQVGASVAWTQQLTPILTFGTILDWTRTTANTEVGETTRLYSLRAFFSTPLSPFTTFTGGARFQSSHSELSAGYREAAVYVGLTHTFH